MNLSNSQLISIGINIGVFLIFSIASIIIIKKIKFEHKGYKYLFVLYTFFWIPIMLLRSYRGTMQNAIDAQFLWIVTSIYGFIGIFARIFADVINYIFKYRKAFLYFCLIGEIILIIPLMIEINTVNNILSAIAIGLGASCIGSYELLFKEQYTNNKTQTFLTISILSIPPLLADFITSPIQSIVKTAAATANNGVNPHKLIIMWYVALCFLIIALIMLIFLKEKRATTSLLNKWKYDFNYLKIDSNNQNWLFISLAVVGSMIAFIKFSNSGAIGTLHIQTLAKLNNMSSANYEGYLSLMFSVFQLIAGVLLGTVLIRKLSVYKLIIIGSGVWIIYTISASFISNPVGYFAIHGLNGFGYGILYNLVLGVVLKITIDNKVITKMGLYQSILAIGITISGWFIPWVKQQLINNKDSLSQYMHIYMIQNMILLITIIIFSIIFILSYYLSDNPNNLIAKNLAKNKLKRLYK